ncbi:hypothetical protein [Streptomyces hoynatensis]|uniref:Uncharacterized protein n=1 Tax=Streptomyces hoynatensis TaxID=1141874 RepID=A0A3A9YVR0_9ACTN|nr:hypothetical protein [Streptomyces hoynatensis]RKN40142.1 hypothetical protein D7294_19820 [Streptomyces hoynatensis]
MRVRVDRSSVAMGDDALPHAETLDVPPGASLAEVVDGIVAGHFLATIAGGRATWVLVADRPLAVLAQQWDEPRYLVDAARPIGSFAAADGEVSLLFRYWKQRDPAHVFAELAAGRTPAR